MTYPCPRCGHQCNSRDYARRHCTPWRIAKRSGYRTDGERHEAARGKVEESRRAEIAKMGGNAGGKGNRKPSLRGRLRRERE